ncbi:MAG: hypothetical protein H6687_01230 [Bacillales bacterium]|nr:hypothetical protein [Bacillales bacterium]
MHTETETISSTTLSKIAPTLSVSASDETQTSFNYTVSRTDPDSILSISKIELLHGEDEAVSLDQSTSLVSSLLSNNLYTVKITYTYDLNDGEGVHTETETASSTTLSKTPPVVQINDSLIDTSCISGKIAVDDKDSIAQIVSVALVYLGSVVSYSDSIDEFNFSSLDSYTVYSIVVKYKYDLNDGNGCVTKNDSFQYCTKPKISFLALSINNQNNYFFDNETITLKIEVSNPDSAPFISAVINDISYTKSSDSSTSCFYIKIPCKDIGEGVQTFVLSEITVGSSSFSCTFNVQNNALNSTTAYIGPTVNVGEIIYTGNDGKETDIYDSESQIVLQFNKGNGLNVDSVNFDVSAITPVTYNYDNNVECTSEQIIKNSDGSINIMFPAFATGCFSVNISSIILKNGDFERAIYYNNRVFIYIVSADTETIEITKPSDLLLMNEGKHYVLMNDIDLSGIEWIPSAFDGFFDGQGYTIKNLSNYNDNTNCRFGLFSTGTGAIKNLTVDGISVSLTTTDNFDGTILYGGLVESLYKTDCCGAPLFIDHCTIGNNSLITITGGNGLISVGGFVGSCCESDILYLTNLTNYSTIIYNNLNYTNDNSAVAGILGHADAMYNDFIKINHCINYGKIKTDLITASGVIGSICLKSDTLYLPFSHLFNYGTISSNKYASGIIGYSSLLDSICSSSIGLTNCGNEGIISGDIASGIINNGGYALSVDISICYNSAAIAGVSSMSAGLCGGSTCYNLYVSNSVNYGYILEGSGLASSSYNTTIMNSINYGMLAGNLVGGILTECNGLSKIESTLNLGSFGDLEETDDVILAAYYSDNIVGEEIQILNCYYISNNINTAKNQFGVNSCLITDIDSKKFFTDLGFDETIWNFSNLDFENGMYAALVIK